MVTTRHSSYMPGQADAGSSTSTPARSSKRKTQDLPDHAFAEKKRKVDTDKTEDTSAKTKTATRIRFGSEDVQPAPVSDIVAVVADSEAEDSDEPVEDEDSDDEAPEDISTSVAQKGAAADALAAEKAIQQQQAADKRKRQEKSSRLEKQAQANKDKTSKAEAQPAKASVEEPPTTGLGSDEDDPEDDEDDEPDLLPEELLDTDFTRPPTPPPTGTSDKIALPSKVIKLDDEPPRDRKVGTVTVSVLPKANDLLPPKASAESKKLREHWLAGKRKVGKKGAVAVERRSFGGSFVKKR